MSPTPSGDDAGGTAVAAAGRFKRMVRPVLGLVAAAFVLATAYDLVSSWNDAKVEVRPGLALLASLPLVASCVVQGIAWIALVERMAHVKTPRLDALALYLASQLARYTPGKVGLPLVRMEGAPHIGLARGLVGISVLIESLSWTATGALLGFSLVALTPTQGDGALAWLDLFSWPLVGATLAGGVVLMSVDRSRYPAKLRRILAPEGEGPLVPLRLPAVQLGYWALVAVHGNVLSAALGASPAHAFSAMGFYVLASVAGFVVLAAPAGLGVREAVLVAGLTPSIGAPAALGAAAFSRILWLVTEIVTWGLTRALARKYGVRASPR